MGNFYSEERKNHYIKYSFEGEENIAFGSARDKPHAEKLFKKYFGEDYMVKEILTQEEYIEKASRKISEGLIRKIFLSSN